jgi:hypothetical protein
MANIEWQRKSSNLDESICLPVVHVIVLLLEIRNEVEDEYDNEEDDE